MREQIGETAGKLWKTLGEKGEISVAMLPKFLKEDSDMINQALGWLAREDKIVFNSKGSKEFVALNRRESQVFKTVH
jgi:hypothetical protein